MKKYIFLIFIPLIIGIILLAVGAAIFVYGYTKNRENNFVTNTFNFDDGTVSGFDIDVSTEDLVFEVSTDGDLKVDCVEDARVPHTVTLSNGTLTIRKNDERKWYEKILSFAFIESKVTVYLPAGDYGELKIKSSTGNITLPGELSFESANIDLSTGNLSMKSGARSSVTVESSTGKIELLSLKAGNIKLTASTGNITLNDVEASGDITAKASTGRVTVKKTVAEGVLNVHTSTGNVILESMDAKSLKIETSTGSVKGTILTSKIFSCSTSTGKVNVPTSTEGGLCEVKTSTGSISLSIAAE